MITSLENVARFSCCAAQCSFAGATVRGVAGAAHK